MAIEDLMSNDIQRSMRSMESQNSLMNKLIAAQEETNRLLRNMLDELQTIRRNQH